MRNSFKWALLYTMPILLFSVFTIIINYNSARHATSVLDYLSQLPTHLKVLYLAINIVVFALHFLLQEDTKRSINMILKRMRKLGE